MSERSSISFRFYFQVVQQVVSRPILETVISIVDANSTVSVADKNDDDQLAEGSRILRNSETGIGDNNDDDNET